MKAGTPPLLRSSGLRPKRTPQVFLFRLSSAVSTILSAVKEMTITTASERSRSLLQFLLHGRQFGCCSHICLKAVLGFMPAKVGQYTTLVVEDVDLSKASRRHPLLKKLLGRKVLHKAPTPSPCSGLADGVPLRPTLEEKPSTTPRGLALESLTASVQSDPGKASSRQPRRGEQAAASTSSVRALGLRKLGMPGRDPGCLHRLMATHGCRMLSLWSCLVAIWA